MKFTLQRLLLLLLPLGMALGARGQTILAVENFSDDGEGFRYFSNSGTLNGQAAFSNLHYFFRAGENPVKYPAGANVTFGTNANPSRIFSTGTIPAAAGFWACEGVRGSNTTDETDPGTVTLNSTPVTNYTGLQVSVKLADARGSGYLSSGGVNLAAPTAENNDKIRIEYSMDGGPFTTVGLFVGDNATANVAGYWRQDTSVPLNEMSSDNLSAPVLTTTFQNFTFGIPVTGNSLRVRVVLDQRTSTEEIAFDDITVSGTLSAVTPPALANIETTPLIYNEGANPTPITSALTVANPSGTTLSGATVQIVTGFKTGQDVLGFTNQNGITSTGGTNGTLTLSGTASVAAYQAALRSVTYSNSNLTTATGGTRLVQFVVSSGSSTSNPQTRSIQVNAQLNAPAGLTYTEDFESDQEGLRYSTNSFTTSTLGYLRTSQNPAPISGTTFSNLSGTSYLYIEGASNAANPDTRLIGELLVAPVNATNYINLQFQVRLGASSTFETDDYVKFYYRLNNGSYVLFGAFYGTASGALTQDGDLNGTADAAGTALTSALANFNLPLPTTLTGSPIDFRVEISNDADEDLALDLIRVSGTLVAPPTVTTAAATSVTTTSAVLGGSVTADGGNAVTERGVVYSTTNTTPTTSDTKDTNGTGTGTFSETILGLTSGTTYYVRAYAINSAGTAYGSVISFTTTPTAPTVVVPGNGALVSTTTPTYDGTAQANSTVTVYVDGSPLGTTTATAGGSWTLTQPAALAQGSHTVFARASINGSAQSANSNTNTFTVDSAQPTVTISSTASNPTSTSPIPFTVTFTEAVTGFVASDVTISGSAAGPISAFTGSGATYTFSVTPSAAGSLTVSIPANVAQDQASNGNTAATPFSISYTLPSATVVSVTRLTPSPTATTQVRYQVVFSSSVSGITVNNFTVATTGSVSGTGISSASGSGTTYTVTVNTGTGNGTLRLNVSSSTGITPTISNVPYTAGQVYTITKSFAAAPQLVLRTGGSASGNFNDVTAFVDQVQVLSGGSPFAGGLQNNSFETNNVSANNFRYATTAVAAPWSFSGNSGVSRNNSGFGSTAAQGDAVGLLQTDGGGSGGSIAQNLAVPTGSYQVNFVARQRSNNGLSDQVVNVFLNDGINDVYLGAILPTSNSSYDTFASPTFSVTAPALTASINSAATSPTSTSPIPVTVTFSASVTGFTDSDVTVGNGTLTGFSGSGSTYTFSVTPSANGTVTVNVPANSAVDANNTGNTAATQFSITYQQLVTAAPVITSPVNNSVTNQSVAISGTAPANSSVTVYVSQNGAAFQELGTYTATASGTFTTPAFPFPTTTYQTYATAQSSGAAVSANSNLVNFIIDQTRPTVAISSSATSPTGTSPIPVTVTFSEVVTGFVAGDVTVTNGTITGNVVNGSGTTYTFTVTPSANGTVTVDVPANVAQDAVGNFNFAAPQFSITYSQLVTAAPAINSPANGNFTNNVTPTYLGSAPAGSTVRVYVDGLIVGTTTATGSGDFSLTQPTALANGSHAVYATAQLSGQGVSANGNTVNFVVDTVAPNTSITSSPSNPSNSTTALFSFTGTDAGTSGNGIAYYEISLDGGPFNTNSTGSQLYTGLAAGSHTFQVRAVDFGSNTDPTPASYTWVIDLTAPTVAITSTATSPTSTSPIPVTVTFSEAVTGFVSSDVTVTNGSITNFSGSGATYTFSVTPSANGTVTVNVPANVAVDAVNNGNTAAPQFSITYNAIVTATTWTGNNSTDWFTAGNWTSGVPNSTISATVPVVSSNRYPLLAAGPASTLNLSLNSGASFTQTGGTLNVLGNLTNNGTFSATGGTVVMGTASAANIVGSSATRFWNLTANANGVSLSTSAGASVQRLLTLNGNLTTNGNTFTLESNTIATAMVLNSGGVVNGQATMQRYIDPSLNAGLGYRHYSSPVQSATVGNLATAGFTPVVNPNYNTQGNTVNPFPTVYGYDETRITAASATTQAFEQGYFSPAALSSPLTVGRGYTVNIAASEKVALTGALNNGTVTVGALSRGTEANSGWQLLGNPYPAPLDWNVARQNLPTGVQDAIYVYKSQDQYDGTYQFYQNGFGSLPSGLVPSMQGFFLRVSQPVASFSFQNAWRSTTYNNPTFNRTTADTRPLVQLDLVSAQGTHEPTYVYFEQGATSGFDVHYDAEKLANTTGLNLSSEAVGLRLAVNGLPPQNAPTVVPLAVGVPTTGTYSLTAASLDNLGTTDVYLHDAVTGQNVNLKQQSSYSFSASNAALITGRFTLNFGPMRPTATKAGFTAASVSLYPNPAHKQFTLLVPAVSGASEARLVLYNVLGQPVQQRTLALPAAGAQAVIDVQELPLGVYMLRIKAGETTVTKQVVVN